MTAPISPTSASGTGTTPLSTAASNNTGTTSSAGTASQTAAASNTGMASLTQPNTFLNLLVDELKYQNPLDPSNSTNFMAQLAQLSQVEQLNNVSDSMQVSEAASLIGKTVTGADAGGASVTGTVTSVNNGTSGPTLVVNGKSISLSAVSKIGG